MNANQTNPVSSALAEEDAQGNSCVQTVQPSVEINACAVSPGETEQIARPKAEPPSAVSTDSINSDAAAEATASAEADNNNSNTITTMSTDNDTPANGSVSDVNAADVTNITPENAVAPASESSNQSSSHPDGELVNPELDTVVPTPERRLALPIEITEEKSANTSAAGTVLSYEPAVFTVPAGGAWLNVSSFQVDDWGFLGAVPVGLTRSETPAPFKIDRRKRTGNQGAYGGHARWGGFISNAFLPPGDYILVIEQENEPITAVANASYGEYELSIVACLPGDGSTPPDAPMPPVRPGKTPSPCNVCGCSATTDGDANTLASANLPTDATMDSCPLTADFRTEDTAAAASAEDAPTMLSVGMVVTSVWNWSLSRDAATGIITITPPEATPLHFREEVGSSTATPVGGSRMFSYALQLQHADGSPCADGTHCCYCLVASDGTQLRFDAEGRVLSLRSATGKLTLASDFNAAVCRRENADLLQEVYSAAEGLMRVSQTEDGGTLCEWFAPQHVTREGNSFVVTAAPYKWEACLASVQDGVKTVVITRRQGDLPAHTLTRVEDGDTITISKGVGVESVVRTIETLHPAEGVEEEIESVRLAGAAQPDRCTRTLRGRTDGGWLTLETTEAFGTPLARTTYYIYNEQYRVAKILRPDGGYTEFAYDSLGRVVMEKSPWGAGLAKVTRTTYADARFFDNRPASVAEYHVNASGTELLFRTTTYAYEETSAMERTTTTVIAAGSNLQQQSIEETFGEQPAYAFAAGKPKFSQGIDGVQTWHDYEATTQHGAVHRHTSITKASGALVAAQSRKTESFLAANGTTTFTQESIWNGSEWLLLDTTAYEYDEQQRVVKTTRGNGRFSTTAWMCCGPLRETDEDGITTTYAYNSAHQLTETSREAVYDGDTCITPETITEFVRDAAGRVISTTRRIGSMASLESTVYDALGRVTTQVDVLGRSTTTAYSEDGLTTTRTTPAGATFVTTRNADGSTASVSGTAQRELVYVYDLSGNNERVTTKLPSGEIIAQSISNGFGQTIVQAQPNTLGGFIYTRSEYNAKGQMVKSYQDTGYGTTSTAPTLYEYDSFGNMVKQTLALTDTPTKDNSPVSETAYSVESAEDGVYSVTSQTHYNAEGSALVSTQKQLISSLSATLASKSISTDERGNSSVNWSEFTAPAKVTSFSSIPTSNITAESISMDGVALSQKDHAGIITTASRSYTATGMTLVQVDGRNNATTSITDIAGRTIRVTDAANATTTTVYDALHDLPAVVTDALGNTSCYKYDALGRKIAEWGTALQPASYGYDIMGNMTSLRTFRAESEDITTDPSERSDYDETTWSFDAVTGLELSKTYADNSSVVKTYDAYNRLATETDARGNVKTHSYEHARGLHLGTTYTVVDSTAATADRSFTYNHLGQMIQLVDDAGVRTLGYNSYGERESDSLVVDGDTHHIVEQRDSFGRSIGYIYSKNGSVQQTVTTGYGTDGRISSAGFSHGGEVKQFGYEYISGTNMLHKLTKPNGMTLTQTYETTRDLLTGMAYHRGSTLVAQREYTYDILGRPTARNTARQGMVVNDTFAHNTRSELVGATVNNKEYEYTYDNIGNRQQATEDNDVTVYDANALNQYTAISENGVATFVPQFDTDGNQTLIKTDAGIWSAIYNAENRPISFLNEATGTVVECAYDSQGRRAYKKVTSNGSVTLHQRYIYRGYLQIACIDLTRSHHPCMWFITWDPSQPVATRPLAIQISGTWYTYGWDLTKNICEIYSTEGYISTSYTYTPFGSATVSGSVIQPIQWSSEVFDETTSLNYYNYRYYAYGYWISRDLCPVNCARNLYSFDGNTLKYTDILGLFTIRVETEGLGHVGVDVGKTSWDFGRYFSKYKWDLETDDICLDTEFFGKRITCRFPLNAITKRAEEIANTDGDNTGPLILKKGALNEDPIYTKYTYIIKDINIKNKIDSMLENVLQAVFDSGIRLENVSSDITNKLVKGSKFYAALDDKENRRYLNTDWSINDNCVTRAVDAIIKTADKAIESKDPAVRQVGKKMLNDFSFAKAIPAPHYMDIWLKEAKDNGIVEIN